MFPTARDPVLSLLQSAAAAVTREHPDSHPLTAAAGCLATDQPVDNVAGDCVALGLELLRSLVAGDAVRQDRVLDRLRYSPCDPLWSATLLRYAATLLPDGTPQPIPYVRYEALDDFVVEAPGTELRVALFSDWGTGTSESRRVAAMVAEQRPDVAIHLGDIYYSGTAAECDAHFLSPLRAVMPDTRLFSLCGNHDVYSGGTGYYGLLRHIGQPASYFCLRSPDRSWQILAGDTGLNDRNPFEEDTAATHLDPREEVWHAHKLRGFPGRTVFLTHHYPFSAFARAGGAEHDPTNPALMASHGRLAAAGRIDAWFWGHEHRLRLYAPYRGVIGRNIGYGAIPVAVDAGSDTPLPGLIDPPAVAADVEIGAVNGVYGHGFVTLDLRAGGIEASYWSLTRPDGPVYRETLGSAQV